jgi:hypothetical protein
MTDSLVLTLILLLAAMKKREALELIGWIVILVVREAMPSVIS